MTQRPADVPPIDEWTALLLGKVAVITGGGDGIGAAIATMFAQHGATVEIAEIDDRGGGLIVNIHSVEGTRGFPGEPVYAAMKAGASHFTQSLAAGYGRKGIRCNGIGSDLIQTPQVDYLAGHDDHDERGESWRWSPAGPTTWPRAALFLASDLSAFVTGHNIPVDGGTLAQSGWFYSPQARRFVNRPVEL
jgi:NAD(P)-dependent dehydrogenase (short-subunit alcohol dehydrogenase family)